MRVKYGFIYCTQCTKYINAIDIHLLNSNNLTRAGRIGTKCGYEGPEMVAPHKMQVPTDIGLESRCLIVNITHAKRKR